MKSCGKDFQVTNNVILKGLENMTIGNYVFIGNNSIIFALTFVELQDEVMVAPNVIIVSGDHGYENGSFRFKKGTRKPILISKGSWVASNSTISKGSTLPNGSVLAANSFLNKPFSKPNSVYTGSPAKWIKKIN